MKKSSGTLPGGAAHLDGRSPTKEPVQAAVNRRGSTAPAAFHTGGRSPRIVAPLVPVAVPAARTVRIVGSDNGAGLSREREVLTDFFQSEGWTVVQDHSGMVADLNLFIESPVESMFRSAKKNVLMPHPEWWDSTRTEAVIRGGLHVWTKTEHAATVFRSILPPKIAVEYVGSRSIDIRADERSPTRTFLHVAGNSPFKGADLLCRAWRADWPQLTIIAGPRVHRLLHHIPLARNVTVLSDLPATALRDLQNSNLFHIYPGGYEGFGHAMWEGLSCGAVVMVPNAPPFDLWPEAFVRLPAALGKRRGLVRDAVVARDAIEGAVSWATALTDVELDARREEARRAWEQNTYEFRKRLCSFLSKRTTVSSTEKAKIVVVHSNHERCGVGEYGRQLDRSLTAAGAVITPSFHGKVVTGAQLVGAQVLLVHFEHGLVRDDLVNTLQAARQCGLKTVFCCHRFDAATAVKYGNLVDRFVIHRDYDGATENPRVVELPLACPVYAGGDGDVTDRAVLRERFQLPTEAVIVTTVGFLTAWKRFPDVLDALLARLECGDGERVHLQFLTAIPYRGDLTGEERKMHAVLERRRTVADRVTFSTAFLPEMEILDRLAASDLGFVFHGQHTGSVSAATKGFVSARCPLVVSTSNHASDLRAGVLRVEGVDVGKFVDTVLRLAGDEFVRKELRDGMESEYSRINMDTVAKQYLNLFSEVTRR